MNYWEAINLQNTKQELAKQLKASESSEETHRILSLIENINVRISEALYWDTTIAHKMYD